MEKIKLIDATINKVYFVSCVSGQLPEAIRNRLAELGVVRNNKIVLLHKSKVSAGGIVWLLSTKLCMDERILAGIEVISYE